MKRKMALWALLLILLPLWALAQEEVIPPQYEVPTYVTHMLQIAEEELGNGEDRYGVTKYGQWAGDPKAEWCAEFLCWTVNETDTRYGTALLKNVYPLYSASNVGRAFFIGKGRYVARNGRMSEIEGGGYQWFKGEAQYLTAGSYIPQPGDWVFFTWTGGTDTDHVAMVEYCTRDQDGAVTVHIIEGNNPSKVARNSFSLTDKRVLGYGTVHDVADWTLRYPDTGEKVRYLQNRLHYLGLLDAEACDGLFGKKTLTAVSTFQSTLMDGKRATGIADISTQNAINAACLEKMKDDPAGYQVVDDE